MCMPVCTCLYVHACMYMPACACLYAHACMRMPVRSCLYAHACMRMPVRSCLYAHASMRMSVCECLYVHAHARRCLLGLSLGQVLPPFWAPAMCTGGLQTLAVCLYGIANRILISSHLYMTGSHQY